MEQLQLERLSIICSSSSRRRRSEWLSLFLLCDLPESLFLEILYRLPLKSVFKFKSVYKYWLSLISDPVFAQTYYSRTINIPNRILPRTFLYSYVIPKPDSIWPQFLKVRHPFFKSNSFSLRFLSNDFEPPTLKFESDDPRKAPAPAPVVVLAVSNGLLLSTSTRASHNCYYICNPLTNQYSALPKPLRIHLWVFVGFIAEPVDGSFQVVRIGIYKGSSNVLNFEIFSSKTGEWKDKTASFNLPVQLFTTERQYTDMYAVSCKRILYWMEYGERLIAYDTKQGENDESIQCSVYDLPADLEIHDKVSLGMIGVCPDNRLRYCHVPHIPQIQNLRVWELRNSQRDYYWSFLYKIRIDEYNMSIPADMRVVALDPQSPDTVYIVHSSTWVFSTLNLKTRLCKHLTIFKGSVNANTIFPFVLPPWPTPVTRISS